MRETVIMMAYVFVATVFAYWLALHLMGCFAEKLGEHIAKALHRDSVQCAARQDEETQERGRRGVPVGSRGRADVFTVCSKCRHSSKGHAMDHCLHPAVKIHPEINPVNGCVIGSTCNKPTLSRAVNQIGHCELWEPWPGKRASGE